MEEQLKNEELKKAIVERKAVAVRLYFDIIKGILIIVGSIIVFITIRQPESILNQQMSQESISRERAKLLIELIQSTNDNSKIALGLHVIKSAYPSNDDSWIEEVEEIYLTKVRITFVDDLINYRTMYPNSSEIRRIGYRLKELSIRKRKLEHAIELIRDSPHYKTSSSRIELEDVKNEMDSLLNQAYSYLQLDFDRISIENELW